jgi:hypothetical protein
MALVAMTTADTVDFVSNMDPCKKKTQVPLDPENLELGTKEEVTIEDGASVFKIAPLEVFLMGHIYDNASILRGKQGDAEIGIHTRINQTNIDAVRFGLRGIPDNFRDKHGKQIRFETEKETINGRQYQVVKSHVLDKLGIVLIQEMSQVIRDISSVSGVEEKN